VDGSGPESECMSSQEALSEFEHWKTLLKKLQLHELRIF